MRFGTCFQRPQLGHRGWYGRVLGLMSLSMSSSWLDQRLVGYRGGLSLRGASRAYYNPESLLGRFYQLKSALGALSAKGVGYLLWGGHRYRMVALALCWHHQFSGLNYVYIWVGGRLPRRRGLSDSCLWLAGFPMLEMVPYSGVSTRLMLLMLWP